MQLGSSTISQAHLRYDNPNTLMERKGDGVSVRLDWDPITDEALLHVATETDIVSVTVPKERVLEAFNHPAVFLNESQIRRVFNR